MSRKGHRRPACGKPAFVALYMLALGMGASVDIEAQPAPIGGDGRTAASASPNVGAEAEAEVETETDAELARLDALLAEDPDNTNLRYERARTLAQSGATVEALAEYDALLARFPDNADWLLGRAQMLSRLGRNAEALTATARALELAPDYEDVWRLRLSLAGRTGDTQFADRVRTEAAARFPDASWWRVPDPPPTYSRFVTIVASTDRLSNDTPDWHQRTVRLDWQSGTASVFAEGTAAERFGTSDSTIAGGGHWQALPAWRLGGAFAATGNADFAPAREFTIDALRSWRDGWNSEFRYRHREYESATVSGYAVTAERYFGNYRIAYRLDYSWLNGADDSLGHSLMLNWYPREGRSFGLTLGAGDEIETIGIDQLLETSVASLTLSGREALTPRIDLGWWLGTHEQGDYYDRDYAGLSVRIGF